MSQQPQGIWRINAYLIFIVGLLSLAGLIGALALITWNELKPQPVRGVVMASSDEGADPDQPPSPPNEQQHYRLRDAQGEVLVIDLVASQRIDTRYGSKTSHEALRNQLFMPVTGGQPQRLLPVDSQLITRVHSVHADMVRDEHHAPASGQAEHQGMLAWLHEVVERDSTGDARLSPQDDKTLFITRPNGTQTTRLAEQVRSINGPLQRHAHELRLLVTHADGSTQLLRFDLAGWTALPATPLPALRP